MPAPANGPGKEVAANRASELYTSFQVPQTRAAVLQCDEKQAAIVVQAQPGYKASRLSLHDIEFWPHNAQGNP